GSEQFKNPALVGLRQDELRDDAFLCGGAGGGRSALGDSKVLGRNAGAGGASRLANAVVIRDRGDLGPLLVSQQSQNIQRTRVARIESDSCGIADAPQTAGFEHIRSEERRVGKEWRS